MLFRSQPTTWFSFFFDLHILACVFPVGLWYCIKNVNDERVFIILYALSAVYFAGVMVRLMLTLTPCVCILAAIAFSKLFDLPEGGRVPQGGGGPGDQREERAALRQGRQDQEDETRAGGGRR